MESLLSCAGVSKAYIFKGDGRLSLLGRGEGGRCPFIGHGGLHIEDGVYPGKACQGTGEKNDQIGQLHQLCQDLGHVVDEGDDLSLGQVSCIHLAPAEPEDRDDPKIDDDVSEGI